MNTRTRVTKSELVDENNALRAELSELRTQLNAERAEHAKKLDVARACYAELQAKAKAALAGASATTPAVRKPGRVTERALPASGNPDYPYADGLGRAYRITGHNGRAYAPVAA